MISIVEDKELEFDEVLSAPLPKAPLEVCVLVCVLACDGNRVTIAEKDC